MPGRDAYLDGLLVWIKASRRSQAFEINLF